jgi:hypothetical protein
VLNEGCGPDLVLSGAYARPHQRIWPKIALDVGRDDLSCDAIARHKPLICARHGDREVCSEVTERKTTLMSVPGGAKLWELNGKRGSRLQDNAPESEP